MAMSVAPIVHSFGQDESPHQSILTVADDGITMSAKKTTNTVYMYNVNFA